jgi:ATP-dependent RNA helicase DeaD
LEVDELTAMLKDRAYRAEAIHGGMSQAQRDRVMNSFRSGQTELLVATDVAARGLDIPSVSHVMNYDVPSAPEVYVHRIGRTGRAGREGAAVTMVEPREQRLLRNIEQLTKSRIELVPLPTVADLKKKRLERTRSSVQKVLEGGDLDLFRIVVDSLAEKFDPADVAAAAVKLTYQSQGGERVEEEIPAMRVRGEDMPRMPERPRFESRDHGRGSQAREGQGRPFSKPGRAGRDAGVAKLYIGAGRTAGIRPGDLVGAIANEASVNSNQIGAIEVTDRFSLVDVPEELSRGIIEALSRTRIKGQKVTVRLFRE